MPYQQGKGSTYVVEYPLKYNPEANEEPYYPVSTAESNAQYMNYMADAKKIKNLYCCGRLGEFKYYNMDQALKAALSFCEKYFEE